MYISHWLPTMDYHQHRKCIANKGALLDCGNIRSFHQCDHAILLPVCSSADGQTASWTDIVLPPQNSPSPV